MTLRLYRTVYAYMKTQCTPTPRATDHKHINHGTISVVRVPYPRRRIRQYENYANYGGAIAPHRIFMYTFYHCSALSHVSPQNLGP